MKTTIKEAYKLATKGPLIAVADIRGVFVAKNSNGLSFNPCVAPMNTVDTHEAKHSAALIAHAFNVLPKVVAALHQSKMRLDICKGRMEACRIKHPKEHNVSAQELPLWIDELEKLIAEASTVEIP